MHVHYARSHTGIEFIESINLKISYLFFKPHEDVFTLHFTRNPRNFV